VKLIEEMFRARIKESIEAAELLASEKYNASANRAYYATLRKSYFVYMSYFSFEWDPEKQASNLAKHGVRFHEASTVFDDQFSYTFEDSAHSHGEVRELTIGSSNLHRLLVVVSTERNGHIRIISAREATKQERKDYQNNIVI
jgi:uncharacterized protein